MRKEKLRKVGLCFIKGCFIKPFQMINNHSFFISQAHSFLLCDMRDVKRVNCGWQITRDDKLNISKIILVF